MTPEHHPSDRTESGTQPPAETGERGMYLYEPAGIRERPGYIPNWLKLVSLSLILWGIQYAIRYWNSY
jgi:hypothetical protein